SSFVAPCAIILKVSTQNLDYFWGGLQHTNIPALCRDFCLARRKVFEPTRGSKGFYPNSPDNLAKGGLPNVRPVHSDLIITACIFL
ncbi:hypothetical protein, partial [Porticoccus sp.]|uniref:hypothetical protein n=1 Tax=Porticoccus sp. TaxID=2024853 RepID=UPI003F698880